MFKPRPPVCVDSCLDLKPFAYRFMARLDFPRSSEYFFEMLSCSVDQSSLDGRYNDGEGELCPDAFFHHIRKFDVDDAARTCNELLKMSFECLCRSGWKVPDQVYVAIDFNNVETWAVKDVFVHKRLGKKETGSSRVHRYASVALVSLGFRFTLAVVPVKNTDPGWDVVRRLLRLARDMVHIDCVLLDREFYDSDVYQMIMDMGLEYIGHVRKSKKMGRIYFQAVLRGERNASYHINYAQSKRYEIELYFKDGEEDDNYDFMVITSNKQVTPFEIDLLFEAYEARWNIENTYCEAKQFKARTNTVQHAYRLILYTLSHLLANLLMIMRTQVKRFTRLNMKKMVKLLLDGTTGPIQISIHLIIDFH
jgi:Transposase DDE domain